MKHVNQIIKALKIKASGQVSSWRFITRKKPERGAQIDLVIDRSDNAITLCEIKYTVEPFTIEKQYVKNLQKKIEVFKEKTGTQKQIFLAMVCMSGLRHTGNSDEIVDGGVVTMEDFFEQ